MKTNKGFFSAALFKENMKRFWPMAFAGFIVYFLSGPMLILTENSGNTIYAVRTAIHWVNPGYIFAALVLSVAAAICAFGYLQKVSSTTVMHSMPFSRRSLYVTSYVSGLVLAVLPALLTAVFLVLFRRPVINETLDYYESFLPSIPQGVDMYSFASIGRWLLGQLILIIFSYSVSAFAGIISGNGVIHMLTACGLNCIVPVLYLLYKIYKSLFLFGVDMGDFEPVLLYRMHPVFACLNGGGFGVMGLDEKGAVLPVHIAVIALCIGLGYFLYRLRPLERATDSYVFRAASLIIGMLLVIVFGSIIGLIFLEGFGTYSGFIIGGIVSFMVAEMIVRKTTKIFDKEGLVSFIACALALGLLVGGFTLDLFGIEDMIPKTASVEHAELYLSYARESVNVRTPENIDRVAAIHGNLLANKDELERRLKYGWEEGEEYQSVTIEYSLRNGRTVSRIYSVPVSMLCEGGTLQAIFDSGEGLYDVNRIRRMDPAKTDVDLWYDHYDPESDMYDGRSIQNYQLSSEQKAALLNAVADEIEASRKDIRSYLENYQDPYDKDFSTGLNGYINISCPLSVAEGEKLIDDDVTYDGSRAYITRTVDGRDGVSYRENVAISMNPCRNSLKELIISLASEIPEEPEGYGPGAAEYIAEPEAEPVVIDEPAITDGGSEAMRIVFEDIARAAKK